MYTEHSKCPSATLSLPREGYLFAASFCMCVCTHIYIYICIYFCFKNFVFCFLLFLLLVVLAFVPLPPPCIPLFTANDAHASSNLHRMLAAEASRCGAVHILLVLCRGFYELEATLSCGKPCIAAVPRGSGEPGGANKLRCSRNAPAKLNKRTKAKATGHKKQKYKQKESSTRITMCYV